MLAALLADEVVIIDAEGGVGRMSRAAALSASLPLIRATSSRLTYVSVSFGGMRYAYSAPTRAEVRLFVNRLDLRADCIIDGLFKVPKFWHYSFRKIRIYALD